MKKQIISLILLTTLFFPACKSQLQDSELKGSIASAHPLASEAGMDILEQGGNAYDAAIAVAAVLNVVEPMMSGIGGYGTILTYSNDDGRIRYLNPSGRFPKKTNTDMMRSPWPDYMKNRFGSKSISTPGNLNAWKEMHSTYGKLEWETLFESAIRIAEEGFVLDQKTANIIEYAFSEFSDYSKAFYGSNNKALKKGDLLIQKDLAETFKIIAKDGVESFYRGDISKDIDRQMKIADSFLSIEDLEANTAEWWEPLMMQYGEFEVFTASLPANSFAAFVNLGLMKQLRDESLSHNSPEYLHLFAEMCKESYKARLAFSFDPDIIDAPLDSILSDKVLSIQAAQLDRQKASEFVAPHSGNSKNTTHYVVCDKWGNIVSSTQTLGNAFGSRVMVEGRGFWLNNSMAYSTFEPKGNPMDAFPGRHKLSGDCPVIITKNGKPWAALGSPGGHSITQNVPQIIINLIDFNMTMQEAIDAPKISFAEPDIILADPYLPGSLIEALEEKGHNLSKSYIGNAHGIKIIYDSTGQIERFETGIDKRGK